LSPPKTANLSLRALGSTDTALGPRSRCETGASAGVGLYAPWRGLEEQPGSALLFFVLVQAMKAIILQITLICILCSGCQAQSSLDPASPDIQSDTATRPKAAPSGIEIKADTEASAKVDPNQPSKSLPEAMKASGYPLYGIQVADFIRSTLKADTGRLNQRFSAVDAVRWWPRESPAEEAAVFCMVPFRLYSQSAKDVRELQSRMDGAYRVTVNRCGFDVLATLGDDGTLRQCTNESAARVLQSGGDVYYAEGARSYILFWNPEVDHLIEQIKRRSLDKSSLRDMVIEYEFDRLSFESPLVWQDAIGYYRHAAMVSSGWDSDSVLEKLQVSGTAGIPPDYLRPEESSESPIVSARLLSASLKTKDGTVVAELKSDNKPKGHQ